MAAIRLLISESNDPWFNLAVEESIFRHMAPTQKVMFLWRNADTVVIGRAQNPWKECNTRKMAEDNIKLARRSSGGGAVFQDLGNTCFTFMAGKPEYDKSISTQIIVDGLAKLGIVAEISGRNDLVMKTTDGMRKVSGSAYRETKDRGFHHGTLLINTDLNRLANYLNPDPKKLQAKGITSVRSRVANLVDVMADANHDNVCQAIVDSFFDYYGETVAAEYISADKLPDIPGFVDNFNKQSDWDWNFGQAPSFNHAMDERFSWGGVELHLDVNKGLIEAAKIFTDSLNPAPLEDLALQLKGVAYQVDTIQLVLNQLIEQYPDDGEHLNQLANWLILQLR